MKKICILIIIIFVLLLILTNKSATTNKKNNTIKKTSTNSTNIVKNTVPDGQVGIISHRQKGYGEIEVIIKNNTGKQLQEVKVTAQCWDKDNNNLGNSTKGIYNVNTVDTYKINIYCKSDMKKYELKLEYK